MKICILIPAYNESQAVGRLVKDIVAIGLDVVVIDDGSSDGTGAIAKANGATVLTNVTNHGKGYSLQRGFDYILSNGYDALITMDGDGQHAVSDLNAFIRLFEENRPDIICGNRMRNTERMPGLRFVTNKVMSGLISVVCRQKIYDTQCGYRLIKTDVLRNIQVSSSAFEIESEVLIKACKKGYHVVSVPIQTIYSKERSKINPFFDTIRFIIYIVRELFIR
jgi:glycosyltransferase involved in cell wall biosynthesis